MTFLAGNTLYVIRCADIYRGQHIFFSRIFICQQIIRQYFERPGRLQGCILIDHKVYCPIPQAFQGIIDQIVAYEMDFLLLTKFPQDIAYACLSVCCQINAPYIIMCIKHTTYTIITCLPVIIPALQWQQGKRRVSGPDFGLKAVDPTAV